jgi:hypothetical protein
MRQQEDRIGLLVALPLTPSLTPSSTRDQVALRAGSRHLLRTTRWRRPAAADAHHATHRRDDQVVPQPRSKLRAQMIDALRPSNEVTGLLAYPHSRPTTNRPRIHPVPHRSRGSRSPVDHPGTKRVHQKGPDGHGLPGQSLDDLVRRQGLEPRTRGLRVQVSAVSSIRRRVFVHLVLAATTGVRRLPITPESPMAAVGACREHPSSKPPTRSGRPARTPRRSSGRSPCRTGSASTPPARRAAAGRSRSARPPGAAASRRSGPLSRSRTRW